MKLLATVQGMKGSASRAGSIFVERMLMVCESLRAQGRSIFEFLIEALHANAARLAPPSLLPSASIERRGTA